MSSNELEMWVSTDPRNPAPPNVGDTFTLRDNDKVYEYIVTRVATDPDDVLYGRKRLIVRAVLA